MGLRRFPERCGPAGQMEKVSVLRSSPQRLNQETHTDDPSPSLQGKEISETKVRRGYDQRRKEE